MVDTFSFRSIFFLIILYQPTPIYFILSILKWIEQIHKTWTKH